MTDPTSGILQRSWKPIGVYRNGLATRWFEIRDGNTSEILWTGQGFSLAITELTELKGSRPTLVLIGCDLIRTEDDGT